MILAGCMREKTGTCSMEESRQKHKNGKLNKKGKGLVFAVLLERMKIIAF